MLFQYSKNKGTFANIQYVMFNMFKDLESVLSTGN